MLKSSLYILVILILVFIGFQVFQVGKQAIKGSQVRQEQLLNSIDKE